MITPHQIFCYDAPCCHFDEKKGVFEWFCVCGHSEPANKDYLSSVTALRTHQDTCMGEDASKPAAPEITPEEATAIAEGMDCG